MEVTVEKQGPCQAVVSFQVPAEEFDAKVRELLDQAGRNVRMKGFRPGKVPRHVIAKQYGEGARHEARGHFLNEAYQRGLKEHELKPLAHPRVDLEAEKNEPGTDFGLEFEVTLRPPIELQEYKGLEIESELAPVMDEQVENAIEELARNQARPEPAGDDGLPEDGMAVCKVELVHGGEVVFDREGLRLGPSTEMPGVDPEAFQGAMTGAVDGAEFELPLTFPDDFEVESARGAEGTCRVVVQQAFKVIVPTREELPALVQLETEEELVAKVREKLEEAHRAQEDGRIEQALLDRLIDAHEIDLPREMLDQQVEARLAQVRKDLEEQNTPAEAIDEQVEAQRPAVTSDAERASKGLFLIEEILQKEGLHVTDEESWAELRSIAQRNQAQVDDVVNYYKENNLVPQLQMEIAERKVRRFLREAADVKTPS